MDNLDVIQRAPVTRDQQLTAATRGAALTEIYDRHVRFVWRNLRRLGVPNSSVEDAVQDVFLVVHRRLPEFQARSQLRTWLFAIVLRVAHNYRRSSRRRQAVLVEGDPVDFVSIEMDDHKRAVFALMELEQMNERAAAEALGVKMNTAYSRRLGARAIFAAAVAELVMEDAWEKHPSPTPSAEQLVDQRRARELLDSVLAQMPIEFRSVFILFELEEMTMPAIAAMLSLPTGTVASRLRRARAMFEDKASRLHAKGHVVLSSKTSEPAPTMKYGRQGCPNGFDGRLTGVSIGPFSSPITSH